MGSVAVWRTIVQLRQQLVSLHSSFLRGDERVRFAADTLTNNEVDDRTAGGEEKRHTWSEAGEEMRQNRRVSSTLSTQRYKAMEHWCCSVLLL